ncbi:MAG: M23 family metallopeptidase [Bacteroidia bacterium]
MASIRKKISTKFKNRYRLIIRKDENLEEKVSIMLTPMNLVLVLSALVVLFGTIIILLLSYTPLSNVLPTTASNFSQEERLELIKKIDSLEMWQRQAQSQEERLREILMGAEEGEIAVQASSSSATGEATDFAPNPVDYSFYLPLKGVVTDTFNVERKHFAVDIAGQEKQVVKAVQKGTVIFSEWNPKAGYTIVIQHSNDFLSVYKHNAVLLKKEGNFVRAGDAIALVGNSGELSSGPHLHFELWNKGVALDPQKYIGF